MLNLSIVIELLYKMMVTDLTAVIFADRGISFKFLHIQKGWQLQKKIVHCFLYLSWLWWHCLWCLILYWSCFVLLPKRRKAYTVIVLYVQGPENIINHYSKGSVICYSYWFTDLCGILHLIACLVDRSQTSQLVVTWRLCCSGWLWPSWFTI